MRLFLFIVGFWMISDAAAQCVGYPCDTVWYDEHGKLRNEFVVPEIRFELGKAVLQTKPILLNDSVFISDSIFIATMYANLDRLARALIHDGGVFEVQHHSDCRSSDICCSKPSQARANAICEYLILQGVDPDKLVPKGYGETTPRILVEGEHKTLLTCAHITQFKESNKAMYEKLHQLNRRVVIKRLR